MIALGLVFTPTIIAHADGGVVTNEFSVKDSDGNIVKDFKANEFIILNPQDKMHYSISLNGKAYSIERANILKTINHVEESLSVIEEVTTLKNSPDFFGNAILQLNKDEVVYRISDVKETGGFIKVRTSQSVEGWILKSALKQNIINVPVETKAFIDDDSEKDNSLFYGDTVNLVGFESNQYKVSINDKSFLINKSAISLTEPPKRIITPEIMQSAEKPIYRIANVTNENIPHNGGLADNIINEARKHLGTPYVWGGTTSNGFDCSGFTQYVLSSQGVSIPRVASDQARVGEAVDVANLQKGDMIFFETYKPGPSHVGFYIGDGDFIHAGGDRVQISNLSTSYYAERYLFSKRMF